MDVGFGDAQSFVYDVMENKDYVFIGIEPYKKGFARAVQFYEENSPKICFYLTVMLVNSLKRSHTK